MDREARLAQANMRNSTYGEVVNTGLLTLFEPKGRVLDIGCGTGAWAPVLRAQGADEIVGIEFAPRAAERATPLYDRVVRAPVETLGLTDVGGQRFDTIIAADTLEHLVDPWRELRRWTDWVAPAGQLVLSVPNLQYFRLVWTLLQGRFDYVDEGGMMDRTHLRWFTRTSLGADLTLAGWHAVVWGAADGNRSRKLDWATLGRMSDFLVPQLRVVARPT